MIHIDRNPNQPVIKVYTEAKAKALDGVTLVTKAAQELEKAIAFFTDPGNYLNNKKLNKKSFAFKIYKNSQLSSELEAEFGRKCAYCESVFAAVTPKDVEHFRPKSEIDTGSEKLAPGYYWLAGDWFNLLVSCPECNRPRKHKVPGQSKEIKLGKSTQFPLDEEGHRVRSHNDNILQEEPHRLLLNPCLDNPEEHLTYDDQGLIYPRPDATGQASAKGKISIEVYALQRKYLVEARLAVLLDVKKKFEFLRDVIERLSDLGESVDVIRDDDLIEDILSDIKGFMGKNAPYQGMLRDYIIRSKAAGEFDDLVANGIDPEMLIDN